jgi:hypothetical protein
MASREARCHGLYKAALRADRAFDKAIKRCVGPKATRWTITQAQRNGTCVHKAYKRKVIVDNARWRACEVMRRR